MRPDVIIVGSGMAGLHAAYPLVTAGFNVLMLDAGQEPGKGFGWKYPLIGARARYATIRKENGRIITQSYVPGGLSEIWGGVCERFNEEELETIGVPALDTHYDIVSERIGLKGTFSEYRGHTTLEELKKHPNFTYKKELVTKIPQGANIVILACGAINTAKMLGSNAKFYKSNRLSLCLSSKRLPSKLLKPVSAFAVDKSYLLLYGIAPRIVIADVRGPRISLRKQGLFSLFNWQFPEGSASHYAGGVEVDENGRFSEGIYVADSAGWRALPSKPIALTIMANANRIGSHIRGLLERKVHAS